VSTDTLLKNVFGGIESPVRKPRYAVLSVPYDMTTSYVAGARNGPSAIIEASTHMELYDDELGCEPWKAGIETREFLAPTTTGPKEMVERVRIASEKIIRDGRIPVMLGGEHSISFGLAAALKKKYKNLSVLQFDAHADMRDAYEDSKSNHACVARRISEICPIVQVGIRSLSEEEAEFLEKDSRKKSPRVKTFYARDIRKKMPVDEIISGLTDEIFITIDLDVFDPAIMAATGTPEPGGLFWYDVVETLSAVISKKKVVGFDVVELCPIPGIIAPDFLAAKLVYKIMGYVNRREDRGKGK